MKRFALGLAGVLLCVAPALAGEVWNVGTWKTAQTVQPFLYHEYAGDAEVTVHPFTNPADQKSALLAGSLDMTGTTLALAIQAASRGEPVALVAALGNKCSALVVRRGDGIGDVAGLKGKRIGYVPGTMHEILLREALTRAGLEPRRDVVLLRVDFFDMGTALARGDIDAYLSGEPLPTLARRQGYGGNSGISLLWGKHRRHQQRHAHAPGLHRKKSGAGHAHGARPQAGFRGIDEGQGKMAVRLVGHVRGGYRRAA